MLTINLSTQKVLDTKKNSNFAHFYHVEAQKYDKFRRCPKFATTSPHCSVALSFGLMRKRYNCQAIKKGKVPLAGKEPLDNTQRRKNDTTVRQARGCTVYTRHRASQQQQGSGQLYVVTRHGYEKEVLKRTPKLPYTRNHDSSLAGRQEQAGVV